VVWCCCCCRGCCCVGVLARRRYCCASDDCATNTPVPTRPTHAHSGFAVVNGFIFSAILESLSDQARYKALLTAARKEVEHRWALLGRVHVCMCVHVCACHKALLTAARRRRGGTGACWCTRLSGCACVHAYMHTWKLGRSVLMPVPAPARPHKRLWVNRTRTRMRASHTHTHTHTHTHVRARARAGACPLRWPRA
jgi:hypothetical protein